MNKKIKLSNLYLLDNNDNLQKMEILIEGSKIAAIDSSIILQYDELIDCNGGIATAGFIDVHIQGAGGFDILDASEEAMITMSKALAKLGTTSFLPTTVAKPDTNNVHIKIANRLVDLKLNGANILGYHLEGPFINPLKKGGLSLSSIYESSEDKLSEILDVCEGNLKMMTIAPEMKGNLKIINSLRENNVIASFAHSAADYIQFFEGFNAGINHVTHLFNAMNPIQHRVPGPIVAIFEKKVPSQIISDGHHLDGRIINFASKNLGVENCVCITDGVQAMGLPEGNYLFNGREYVSKDGAAKYLDGTLIGSTTPLGKMAKLFRKYTNCKMYEALSTVSSAPAKVLGIDSKKGFLKVGFDADIIIIDKDFNVNFTFVGGKLID